MDAMNTPHLVEFRKSLQGWTDERFASKRDIEGLAMFSLYLVNLAEADGWHYDGHSFKMKSPMSTLVVRATIDDIPHVVFSSGRNHTACVRAFMRKLEEGWLEWVVDRFR